MKIIYVENVRVPSERAHAYQITQTCAWFTRAGHDVVLVNPDRAGGKNLFQTYGLPDSLFQHVTLEVTDPLAWTWFPKKLAYLWQRASFVRALRRWTQGQSGDVWFTRDPAMIDALSDDPSRKFVLELHDRPDAQPKRWLNIKDRVWKFVVITRGLGDVLQKLGVDASRIHVAPDGYDPQDFEHRGDRNTERTRFGVPHDAFVAMYTGGFYPWKGVDLVVQAWSKTASNAHLVFIGGPDGDRRRLESLVDKSAADRMHIFPAVEHAAAIRALAAADIGLLTSSEAHDLGRVFTSPLKQFEYLAAGLPILASDVPSSHEVLNQDVAMFYPYTPEGFIAAVEGVSKDVAWRTNAAQKTRTVVAPYTWEARAKGILEHIT